MPYTPIEYYPETIPGTFIEKPSRQNEDACFPSQSSKMTNETRGFLAAVLDGMSSGGLGNSASQKAVFILETRWRQYSEEEVVHNPLQTIYELMSAAQDAVLKELGGQGGTTCMLLLIQGDLLTFGHVGDCQLYHSRQGKLTLKTQDQSALLRTHEGRDMREQFVQFQQQGSLLPVDFQKQYAVIENQLTRYLGHPDLSPTTQAARSWVEVGQLRLQKGDVLVACTDGVIKVLSLESLPVSSIQDQSLSTQLAERVRNQVQGYDHDDATFCVVRVYDTPDPVARGQLVEYSPTYLENIREEKPRTATKVEVASSTEPQFRSQRHGTIPNSFNPPTTGTIPSSRTEQTSQVPHSSTQTPQPVAQTQHKGRQRAFLSGIIAVCCVVGVLIILLPMFSGTRGQNDQTVISTPTEQVAIVATVPTVQTLDTATQDFVHTLSITDTSSPQVTSTVVSITSTIEVSPPLTPTQANTADAISDELQQAERIPQFGSFTYPSYTPDFQLESLFGSGFKPEIYRNEYRMHQFQPEKQEWEGCTQNPWSCTDGRSFPYLVPPVASVAFVGTIESEATQKGRFHVVIHNSLVVTSPTRVSIHIEPAQHPTIALQPNMSIAVIGQYVRTETSYSRYFGKGKNIFATLAQEQDMYVISVDWIRILSESGENWLFVGQNNEQTLFVNPVWLYIGNIQLLNEIITDEQVSQLPDFGQQPAYLLIHGQWNNADRMHPKLQVQAIYERIEATKEYSCIKALVSTYVSCQP